VKRDSAFEARGKGIAGASNAGFPPALLPPAEFLPAAKVTIWPEGQNFADLIAVVYRLPTGVLAVVLARRHG
jgi:hypothetical protein